VADPGYLQPISKAAFDEMGEEAYSRDPVSVGPFSVKEWETGTRILLERNDDYNWGPATLKNQGAYLLDFIEFRIIPEYATIVAGMESGEIDFAYASFQQTDIDALKATGMFDVFEAYQQGIRPYITLNVSKPPFDDILVRKAVNLAIDREALLSVAEQGNGIVQYGPISSATVGYWDGVEQIGYGYDLEQAKTLMEEAGYSLNDEGILEKDGQPLTLTFITTPDDRQVKVAQVVKEQLKELGVDLTIETMELGTLLAPLMSGDYQIGSLGMTFGEADLMHIMFHSSNVGAYNFSQLASPEMDEYLDATRNATDPSVRQEAVDNAQRYLIEQAIVVPLYTPVNFIPVNKRAQGAYYNEALITVSLESAHIEE
jgi:peptide/nickel transport system substrate-binding protein